MYALARDYPLDLANEVVAHMVAVSNRAKGMLPYAMHITKILKHFGVDLRGEEKYKLKTGYQVDISLCGRLGYKTVEGRGWVPKVEDGADVEAADPSEEQGQANMNEEATEGVQKEEGDVMEQSAQHGEGGGLGGLGGSGVGDKEPIHDEIDTSHDSGHRSHAGDKEMGTQRDEFTTESGRHTQEGGMKYSRRELDEAIEEKLEEMKQELKMHITKTISSLHLPPSHAPMGVVHSSTDTVGQSTPVGAAHTPLANITQTTNLSTTIASPTVLITPSPTPHGLQSSTHMYFQSIASSTRQLSIGFASPTVVLTPSPTPIIGPTPPTAFSSVHAPTTCPLCRHA